MSTTHNNLLVELFVEELPPKALERLGQAFAEEVYTHLEKQQLLGATARSGLQMFASPRRLAVYIPEVHTQAAERQESHKLMPVAVGLDAAGQATPALLKKLAALGADSMAVTQLRREGEGKAETLFLDRTRPGATLIDGLQEAVTQALSRLPIPKVMSYQLADGWSTVNFVRPAHGLVALHGDEVVPITVLGLRAGRQTHGHRFEASVDPIVLKDADSYSTQMEHEGAVIPGFALRRAEIARQLAAAAAQAGAQPVEDAALLDEVTALVERPNVLLGRFEERFLEVPPECLILTMKANQKYFPLIDAQGRLTHQFLIVSNIRPKDTSAVVGGNERVVRPRLADAQFFFETDRKTPLAQRVEKLGRVVYHNKLGTQRERIERLIGIARQIAVMLHADAEQAGRAALLAKADLVTDMVGEFPELQGIMGRYYALHDGEPTVVADAIEAHYKPRFAGDILPQGNIACATALADKLDVLAGLFSIGQIPTGDKDPFGLRRAALGVLRILMEIPLPLPLDALIAMAVELNRGQPDAQSQLFDFMLERLRGLLREAGHAQSAVEAVLAQKPTRIDLIVPKLEAVRVFMALPEAEALAAANKRIVNLLKKTEGVVTGSKADMVLLQEPAEQALFEKVTLITPRIHSLVAGENYTEALTALAGLRGAVDGFFEDVMVMAEDPLTRQNRLALLNQLSGLMNQVADISRL